ncbi:hypothetical protein [Stenotrophomonas maltophilia]|uniref:hypothetical protein n=1 Tax=Stenotrophomonas maltophilia TaxID=40324 RepID=UPI00021E0E4E|nr:hypothetical protein [Stenotrophomonas maltophilia]AEM51637.1 hypothetical protein BurJV3_2315 [Stenotrophomonas maltophilia JV3]
MAGKSRKDRIAQEIGLFMQQYARKAQRHTEPNDRPYDRKLKERLKRLPPEELGRLLSGEEDDDD